MTALNAAGFGAERDALGDQPIVVLTDAARQRRLRIALHGAAVLGFEVTTGGINGVVHELAAGYRSAADIAARPGSRYAILVPFAGRIADARYTFDGQPQDLQPGVADAERASRHGFVRDADFVVDDLSAGAERAQVILSTAIRPQPGYPHAIDLELTFTLDSDGFHLQARMRNAGASAAPCFFGWHAYFQMSAGEVDGWQLQIPAETLIRTGADLIALPGTAAYVPLDDAPTLDFRKPRLIADSTLDQGYTDLQPEADGRIRTRLRDPISGVALAVWQERGVMHAFTADTLSHGARRSLALEPMECMADAFNRADCADAIRLEPGAERIFRCGVEVASA